MRIYFGYTHHIHMIGSDWSTCLTLTVWVHLRDTCGGESFWFPIRQCDPHDPGLFQTDSPPPSALQEASPGKFPASAAPPQLKTTGRFSSPLHGGGNTHLDVVWRFGSKVFAPNGGCTSGPVQTGRALRRHWQKERKNSLILHTCPDSLI